MVRFLMSHLGQSTGIVQLFDRKSLDAVLNLKIHKTKITHVEFSKHHEYLLATASVGHEVKIWDVRNMKDSKDKVHDGGRGPMVTFRSWR